MNILYHHRTQGKGGERAHIRGIVCALREAGHSIFMVSPSGISIFEEGKSKIKLSKTVYVNFWFIITKYFPQILFEIIEILYNVVAFVKLYAVIKINRIDLIYERYSFFCFAPIMLAKQFKIPIILEVNEIVGLKRQRGQVLRSVLEFLEKRIFKNVDAVIVVSSFLNNEILKRKYRVKKVFIMPNAVNISQFNVNISGDLIRRQLKLENKIVLTFVGRLSVWDNIDFLVDCFAELLKKKDNLYLLIIGCGKRTQFIKDLISLKEIDSNVSLISMISEDLVPQYLAASDICLLPHSNNFGSPIVLFEYMSMGKAVVVPKLPPIEDVIKDGINGRMFSPMDIEDFCKCILELAECDEKRKFLGSNARKCITEEHLWMHNTAKIIKIYESIKNKNMT